MLKDLNNSPGIRALLIVACLVIVIYGLREAATILLAFLLALFVSILGLPLLLWLRRHRVPTGLAVVVTVLAIGGVMASVGVLVGRTFEAFVTALPRYVVGLDAMAAARMDWMEGRGVPVRQWISVDNLLDPARIIDYVGGTLRGIAAALTFAFLVLLLTIFVLLEAAAFPAKLRAAIGNANADLSRFSRITQEVQRYLRIKTVVSMATGLLVGGWCWLLGIDFPLLWGLVGFLFNYIPNIGSVLAAVPPVLLALVQFSPSRALLVIGGYLAVNVTLGNIVEPQLLGRRLGLSPLAIVLSLVFWGWIWGPLGMMLAVPLTMSVKIMLENTPEFRWVGVLLGGGPAEVVETGDDRRPAAEPAASVSSTH